MSRHCLAWLKNLQSLASTGHWCNDTWRKFSSVQSQTHGNYAMHPLKSSVSSFIKVSHIQCSYVWQYLVFKRLCDLLTPVFPSACLPFLLQKQVLIPPCATKVIICIDMLMTNTDRCFTVYSLHVSRQHLPCKSFTTTDPSEVIHYQIYWPSFNDANKEVHVGYGRRGGDSKVESLFTLPLSIIKQKKKHKMDFLAALVKPFDFEVTNTDEVIFDRRKIRVDIRLT